MTLHPYVNLGIAVDLDQQGLVVPVVKDADGLNMRGIAKRITELAGAARGKKLAHGGHAGLDVHHHQPRTRSPATPRRRSSTSRTSAILCTDGVKRRPVAVGDAIAIHPTGIIGLVYDHRAFDGSTASLFLDAHPRLARAARLGGRGRLTWPKRPARARAGHGDGRPPRRPGREADFEDWSDALTRAASAVPRLPRRRACCGPGHVGEPWHVVFRFASARRPARPGRSRPSGPRCSTAARAARALHRRAPRLRARDLVRAARPDRACAAALEDVPGLRGRASTSCNSSSTSRSRRSPCPCRSASVLVAVAVDRPHDLARDAAPRAAAPGLALLAAAGP